MKRILVTIFLVFSFTFCQSQNLLLNYTSASIADSLKKDANSVLRLDEGMLEVLSPSKYIMKVHQIVTILNAEGAYHLRHSLRFDKFYSVGDIAITVYNDLGLPVKKYSKKDFEVEAAYDGISLVTDDKVMRLTTPAPGYPCTIETQYEIKAGSYIELPDWYISTGNASTEIFRYNVTVPSNLDIRYHSVNFDLSPSVQSINNKKVYSWEAKNIRAKKLQQGGFQSTSYAPRIEIAPTVFEYDGYTGQFSSWQDFGKWNFALYQEMNPFPEARRNEIKSLVAGYTDVKTKIDVLYEYLKKNMRYVSIQFGIGGFKPFSVKYVDEKKYGDCKALTNYMRYLLDVVGIKSYPALINAGNESPPVDPLFPSSTFNHVILCIPDKPDSIWLECTSNNLETGFLGTFTENKNALLLTENGGILTKTPSSKAENNLMLSSTEIIVDEEGGGKAHSSFFGTGDIAQEFREIRKMQPDDQKEVFVNYFHYRPAENFEISSHKDSAHGHSFQLNFEFEKLYAFKAGNKFFLPQKLNGIFYENLKDEKRNIDFLFDYPYHKADTTIFVLPMDFVAEELPAEKEIKNEFASYKKEVVSDSPRKIKIITSLSLKKHVVPADQYKKIQSFFAVVRESEDQNIVVKKL